MKSTIFKIPKYQSPTSNSTGNIPEACSLIVLVKADEMNEMTSTLLNKILSSIDPDGKVIKQIVEFNRANPHFYTKQIKNKAVQYVICFGLSPADIGLNILAKKNQTMVFATKKLLFTYSISSIRAEEEQGKTHLKRTLWTELKSMFNMR